MWFPLLIKPFGLIRSRPLVTFEPVRASNKDPVICVQIPLGGELGEATAGPAVRVLVAAVALMVALPTTHSVSRIQISDRYAVVGSPGVGSRPSVFSKFVDSAMNRPFGDGWAMA